MTQLLCKLAPFILIYGCASPYSDTANNRHFVAGRADVTVQVALADSQGSSTPLPDPDDELVPGQVCPTCDGSGRSGDGIGECGVCGGDGKIDENDISLPPIQKVEPVKVKKRVKKRPQVQKEQIRPKKIKWYSTLAEGIENSGGKPVFIYFTTPTCMVCVPFWRDCLLDEDIVAPILSEFSCVKVNYSVPARTFTRTEGAIFLTDHNGEKRNPSWPFLAVYDPITKKFHSWQPHANMRSPNDKKIEDLLKQLETARNLTAEKK